MIGAARSGTKLIREVIAEHSDVDAVPYDINFLWRLGNERLPHDELGVELATPTVRRKIRKVLGRFRSGRPWLVEKTVSNCLRVQFVDAVLPDAIYVHIVRNGWDVVESAARQWRTTPSLRYLFGKAMAVPWFEEPRYVVSYGWELARKWIAPGNRRRSSWGPRYNGIDEDIRLRTPIEVCAVQWSKCVEKATYELGRLSSERVLTLRYEDLVQMPREVIDRVAEFVGLSSEPFARISSGGHISPANVGKGIGRLSSEQRRDIALILAPVLAVQGYESAAFQEHYIT